MTSNNIYRVGDCVYFEESASAPYQIRRIEELDKVSGNEVDVKVRCFYRRRDLPSDLSELHPQNLFVDGLSDAQIHQLSQRELFVSQHVEMLQATHIRGKCSVNMHDDVAEESLQTLLDREDTFFYQLSYDPVKKTLQAEKGCIRVGSDFQATIPDLIDPNQVNANHKEHDRETRMWSPPSSSVLSTSDIDAYLTMCKSLATLARANYAPSSLRHPSLISSAACASRDTTHQLAMDTLQEAGHSIPKALKVLAPPDQAPILRLDEMEKWSITEGNLFQQGLQKFDKSFREIQKAMLPWKSLESLVGFYYMWKTTDHYLQQKRAKGMDESERRLKQIYISNYSKPNQSVLYPPGRADAPNACEGCEVSTAPQWYALGASPNVLKVCSNCWSYWKRYGDLKHISVFDKLGPLNMVYKCPVQTCDEEFDEKINLVLHLDARHPQYGSACANQVQPTPSTRVIKCPTVSRNANFFFLSSPNLRFSRRMETGRQCRQRARRPFKPIMLEMAVLKALLVSRLAAHPNLLTRLAAIVYGKKVRLSKDAAAERLLSFVKKITPFNEIEFIASKRGKIHCSLILLKNPSYLDPSGFAVTNYSNCSSTPLVAVDGKSDTNLLPSNSILNTAVPPTNSRAETLMFHATKNLKRKRREVISSKDLHRLCRRPWSTEVITNDLNSRPNENNAKLQ
ncbi:unnamed protein product [Hydatigera taeniaeformis]|uniref:Metastasis-associated protein MTA3 n=1 Tax=Hydatigena taeniaeformis TaxID=6205 RepID=A0A0R3X1S5_HYDTA|nr:unnamed protein product [Hydatigera taeniaeformis]